jgi:hypothetical protein
LIGDFLASFSPLSGASLSFKIGSSFFRVLTYVPKPFLEPISYPILPFRHSTWAVKVVVEGLALDVFTPA